MPEAKTKDGGRLTVQHREILRWLSAEGRQLYGPMASPMGSRERYGFAGGSGPTKTVLLSTGNLLVRTGMIAFDHEKYPLGYYRITDAGRSALAQEAPDA